MKRFNICITVLFLFVLLPLGVAWAGSSVEGRWLTDKKDATVEVKIEKGVLRGKLVAAKNPKAPLGLLILRDFKAKGDSWEGKIFVPKRSKTFDASISLKGARLKIEVSAGLFGKTIYWTRAK